MFRVALGAVAAVAAAIVFAVPASSDPPGSQSCPKPPALPDEWASQISNRYLPLTPGTVFTYKGKLDGKPATDVFTVTRDTREIEGVTTTVIHDQVFQGGDLVEDTFDWFAQAADGTVWYCGEDTKELDHGTVTSTEGPGRLAFTAPAPASSCLPTRRWATS